MYLIYTHNLKDNNIKPLDFSETSEEAYKLLEENAKEFIIEYEGKKKWDCAFIDEKTELNKLKDGFYLIKKNNAIEVYNKISETINTGWILNSQEVFHKLELNSVYTIAEFQRHLLNKFITSAVSFPCPPTPPLSSSISISMSTRKTNDIPDKMKPNVQARTNLDSLIDEIKKNGFKPIPRKVKVI